MLKTSAAAGFTLIEVLVGLAILGVLLALGLPAFSTAMVNSKIRASASSFHAAAQFARTEAIRRNSVVELILTTDAPTVMNEDTVNVALTGPNWMVRAPGAPAGSRFLQGKSANEGGASGSVVVTGNVSQLAFDGLGASTAGAATFSFTSTTGGACASASGPVRCLDVRVSASGQTQLCDPAITAVSDSRACN